MAGFADAFAACFDAAMPGVVSMTWVDGETSASANVQFFSEPSLDSDGYTQVQRRAYRVQGLTSAIGTLRRGDSVTLASQAYRCVSNALDDGFGVSEIHLETAP
jgi:hypothetical protein